jgi:hypothetical protein
MRTVCANPEGRQTPAPCLLQSRRLRGKRFLPMAARSPMMIGHAEQAGGETARLGANGYEKARRTTWRA